MPVDVTYVCNYSYESRRCYGCYGCTSGNDYCRGAVYEGLTISFVNIRKVVARILSVNEEDVSDEIITTAHNWNVGDFQHYRISTEPDYYGESVVITFDNDDMIRDLRRKFGRTCTE